MFSAAHLLRGTLVSWCTFRLVASKTNCRQVECCSLCCAASIFLLLLVATWLAGQTMDAPSAVVVCDACCLWCTFPASWGARSHRGRMAVYSQQPTFSGAPWFPGVHSAWWHPKRTADKSSAAPCVALHLYSCPCWLLRG